MSASHKITITLPAELLKKVDLWGEHELASRSDVVRMALLAYLREPHRMVVTKPDNGALDKMYEQIKEYYPYLSRHDEEMVVFLYKEKMGKME
jgi:metal-responsive CopG/Arc/MetJ family transcriptional regulator